MWIIVIAAAGVIAWRVWFQISEAGLGPQALTTTAEAGTSDGTDQTEQTTENAQGDKPASDPNGPAEGAPKPQAATPGEANEPDKPGESARPADPNTPGGSAPQTPPDRSQGPSKPDDPNDPPKPDGPDKPEGDEKPDEPDGDDKPDGDKKPDEEDKPKVDPETGEPLEAVNLKDVEMKNIVQKISEWTGKVVIPTDEAMKQKITIYAPKELPRSQALAMIYSALRTKEYVVEESESVIYLKPIAKAKLGLVPTIGPDEPLAAIENKEQIVEKIFKLENYSPAQMSEVVKPLVGEYGHVSADEVTSTLLVIDTVANLMRVERLIDQFDVPEAGQFVTEIIEIRFGDPAEIVQLLRMLMGESPSPGGSRGASRSMNRYGGRSSRPSSSSGSSSSVVTGPSNRPIVLIPLPKQKWIIARGAPDDLKQIRTWVEKLDMEEPIESEYETIPIIYADPREVAQRIEEAFQDMPGTELRPSVAVKELEQSRQILVFGRKDLRDMVRKIIEEIDIPPGEYETKHFILKHADPEQVKQNLDNLYGENIPRYEYYSYYRYGPGSRRTPADTVKAIAFPMMNQVTVIASAENMRKIEKQIEEWDTPLDVEKVKPRIIELRNSDPVQMAQLMTKLFTEEAESTSSSLFRIIFFDEFGQDRKKIVGPLYGQLTFESVPGTKKIIVISKIPEAYEVIEKLILELDRQEMAEVPKVITLKYADPEDLAERLNAIFNEPGTRAPIRRTARGLSSYSMDAGEDGQSGRSDENQNQNPDEYLGWWTTGRRAFDEEPISNVIGKVRFIPDPHTKAILVLAPPEFMPQIEETIGALDIPGKQVMIKAIIIEVDHSSMTSLGVQLSSNPLAFGSLEENAITALGQLTTMSTHGSITPGGGLLGYSGTGSVLGTGTDLYALVDFLQKTVDARILNQQTLWTKDNEEADFFKGSRVGFVTGSTISTEGRLSSEQVNFERVGMALRARPSITPESRVDMIVNVLLSQLTADEINNQPVRTEMETTTNMIVEDGETIMLGGILFQKDSIIKRKVPVIGDVPVLGGLFRHNHSLQSNSELIVFITPYVIDDSIEMSEKTARQIREPKEKLDKVRRQLEAALEKLQEDEDEE